MILTRQNLVPFHRALINAFNLTTSEYGKSNLWRSEGPVPISILRLKCRSDMINMSKSKKFPGQPNNFYDCICIME
jgi:hypothetical protein